MKNFQLAVSGLFLFLTSFCWASIPPALDNVDFGLKLYQQLESESGNIFFSPYSVRGALGMTGAGARGETAKQMSNALAFDVENEQSHRSLGEFEKQLGEIHAKGKVQLHSANSLWLQEKYKFLASFLDLVKSCYQARLESADFINNAEGVRTEINRWVEEQTQGKITGLIPQGVLDKMTRLVLVNAIYFKGDWLLKFKKEGSREDIFQMDTSRQVKAFFMNQTKGFSYMEDDAVQILDMPYVDGGLSMLVILPKKVDGLKDLEKNLDVQKLNSWLGKLTSEEVRVSLPKFKTTSSFSLAEKLGKMGMADAFTEKADFSGMTGDKDLYISAVIHKAFVNVDEEGTEAAAATAVMNKAMAMPIQKEPKIFKADHPFVFMIRHNPSGNILFMGRIVDPTK